MRANLLQLKALTSILIFVFYSSITLAQRPYYISDIELDFSVENINSLRATADSGMILLVNGNTTLIKLDVENNVEWIHEKEGYEIVINGKSHQESETGEILGGYYKDSKVTPFSINTNGETEEKSQFVVHTAFRWLAYSKDISYSLSTSSGTDDSNYYDYFILKQHNHNDQSNEVIDGFEISTPFNDLYSFASSLSINCNNLRYSVNLDDVDSGVLYERRYSIPSGTSLTIQKEYNESLTGPRPNGLCEFSNCTIFQNQYYYNNIIPVYYEGYSFRKSHLYNQGVRNYDLVTSIKKDTLVYNGVFFSEGNFTSFEPIENLQKLETGYTCNFFIGAGLNDNDLFVVVSANIDMDGDGSLVENDCDDNNPDVSPDLEEIFNNEVDENCDGLIEVDADDDGFSSLTDCNDNNPDVNPDAEEISNNNVDEDCDGVADADLYTEKKIFIESLVDHSIVEFYHNRKLEFYSISTFNDESFLTKLNIDADVIWQKSVDNQVVHQLQVDRTRDNVVIRTGNNILRYDQDGNLLLEYSVSTSEHLVASNEGEDFYLFEENNEGYNVKMYKEGVFIENWNQILFFYISSSIVDIKSISDDFFDVHIEGTANIGSDDYLFENLIIRYDWEGNIIDDEYFSAYNSSANVTLRFGHNGNSYRTQNINGEREGFLDCGNFKEIPLPNDDVKSQFGELSNKLFLIGNYICYCSNGLIKSVLSNPSGSLKYKYTIDDLGIGYNIDNDSLYLLLIDFDQDGFIAYEDCDDINQDINPSAIEIPNNGIDEDCDGSDLTTSINEQLANQIKIYPNPVSEILYIESEINAAYRFLNMVGQEIQINKISIGMNTITVSSFYPGVYFLEIRKHGDLSIMKVIVN